MRVAMDWKALAVAVRQRRDELGLTQEQVTERDGPSVATVRLIESAGRDRYQHFTLAALERALDWPKGRCRAILAGQPVTQTKGDVRLASLAGFDEQQLELIAEAVLAQLPPAAVGRIVQKRLAGNNHSS